MEKKPEEPEAEETKAEKFELPKPKERKKYNVFEHIPTMGRKRGLMPKKQHGKMIHLSKAVVETDKGRRVYKKTFRKPTEKEKEEMAKLAKQAEKPKERCNVEDCDNEVLRNGLCISHDDDDW